MQSLRCVATRVAWVCLRWRQASLPPRLALHWAHAVSCPTLALGSCSRAENAGRGTGEGGGGAQD